MIRLPNMPMTSTPQRSAVRMPSISPRVPDFAAGAKPYDMRISGREMAAPYAALAEVGQAIGSIGERLFRIAEVHTATKRRNDIDEAELRYKESAAALEIDWL